MEAILEPTSDVVSAPILIDRDEPNQLVQSAYHEPGHVVADVGLLGEFCSDVRAFAQPTLTYDRPNRPMTVMRLCQTSREPLDGDIAQAIVGRHLRKKRLRVTPIVRVTWCGVVNASILDAPRIAPDAIPIISIKDDNKGHDVDGEFIGLATDDDSCLQTEMLSDLHKYVRPDGRTWRTDVSQLLKLNDVEERVCLKRAKIYALIETGDFPPPVKLTPGRSVWLADEITAWVQRKAEASRKTAGGSDVQ